MNANQLNQAAEIAKAYIEAGDDPKGLVHVIYYPSNSGYDDENEIMGLSSPLKADENLSGHTEKYYTLEELAG